MPKCFLKPESGLPPNREREHRDGARALPHPMKDRMVRSSDNRELREQCAEHDAPKNNQ